MEQQSTLKRNGWETFSRGAVVAISVATIITLFIYSILFWDDPRRIGIIFVSVSMTVWTLGAIWQRKIVPRSLKWNAVVGSLIVLASGVVAVYFYTQFPQLLYERAGNNSATDFVMGSIAIFLVIFLTWRMMGSAIPIVAVVALIYAYFGPLFPGFLNHPGLSLSRILQMSAVELQGIYGSLNSASITLVIIFVFFGGLVLGFGGLDYIINLSMKMLKRFKYGLTQMPVIASMLFGTFSGSSAANVAGTGSFTIPMMKGFGIKPQIAGAIESVASTGGQVMPPVMGIAAFLMADFLGVHYIEIVLMGFAPAVIFYLATAFAVYLRTRSSIDELDSRQIIADRIQTNKGKFDVAEGLPIAVSLALLLFSLIFYRVAILTAGFYAIFTFLGLRLLYDFYRQRKVFRTVQGFSANVKNGLVEGTQNMASLMVMLGCMGIVVRVLVITGLAQKLAFGMVDIAGGHLYPLLFLILVVCTLFGMAVSTVVAYLLVVLLAVPALQTFGIPPFVSHFTVFYIAVLSAITPPVAIACAVGASIARASYLKTCKEAMMIGAAFFVMPFSFIWYPEVLQHNLGTLLSGVLILLGSLNLIYAINSRSTGIIGYGRRAVHLVLGAIILFPTGALINVVAIVGVAVLVALQLVLKRIALAPKKAKAY